LKKAISDSQKLTIADPVWTGHTPGLDNVFWRTRTIDTGPGITFYRTQESAIDSGVHSGLTGAVRSVSITNAVATSNWHGADLRPNTIIPGLGASFGLDGGISNDAAKSSNPKSGTMHSSQVAVSSKILPEAHTTHSGQQMELIVFPTSSIPTSPGSVCKIQDFEKDKPA
jgi:hypothetical protein